MQENKEKRPASLWKQKGFYVSAICLVMVLVAVSYFSHLSSVQEEKEKSSQKQDTNQESMYVYPDEGPSIGDDNDKGSPKASDNTSISPSANTEKSTSKPSAAVTPKSNTSAAANAAKETTAAKTETASASTDKKIASTPFEKSSLTYPSYGTVLNAYSGDKLVKSKTLDEWCYHGGIDIKADLNAQVKSVADGIVENVYTDPDLGRCVLIDHQNGFKTLYANLLEKDLVKKGDHVTKGQIIGGIGKTAISEVAEDAHLHFEMLQNDKEVNPTIYLRKTAIEN